MEGFTVRSCGISRNTKETLDLARSSEFVVMESGTDPGLAGGDSQIARVLLRIEALVTACPNTHPEAVLPKNAIPFNVIRAPPCTGPWLGKALMTEARCRNSYVRNELENCSPLLVTLRLVLPGFPGGEMHSTVLGLNQIASTEVDPNWHLRVEDLIKFDPWTNTTVLPTSWP
jgi:hypothetical protein